MLTIANSAPMPDPHSNALAVLIEARNALTEASALADVKNIRDKAEAARQFARSAALGLQIQNMAAELKLRAERKAGQLLAGLSLRGGDRKSNAHHECVKLADLGIDHNQSSRWQREAAVPDAVFEHYVSSAKQASQEITTQGLLRVAKQKPYRPLRTDDGQNGRNSFTSTNDGGHDESWATRHEIVGDTPKAILAELENRRNLLSDILLRVCSCQDIPLQPIDRHMIQRLLDEVRGLLEQLERQLDK